MKISLITATYNREDMLPTLYKSICDNYKDYKDIEWVIVDDGSKDNTKKLVESWIKKSKFKIVYIYQDNAGKMKAINKGMKKVTGDIVIEIDSDDYFTDGAFKQVIEDYKKLDNNKVYGIVYKRRLGKLDTTVDKDMDGSIIRLFDIHNKYGYDFDMAITFKTDIRKKYEYIVEDGEKFVTEARTYYAMDNDYSGLLFIDKEIVVGEYMEDGYSKNISNMFKKYPKGYYEYFNECLSYVGDEVLFKKKLYFIKHYILFSYLTGKSMKECVNNAKGCKGLVRLLVIPGYMKSKRF